MAQIGRKNGDVGLALALARGLSVKDAARQAGISERTAYRRLSVPIFSQRIQQTRAELFDRVVGLLGDANADAVATLRCLLKANSETVRLGACRAILEIGAKMREHVELERRVSELEWQNADRYANRQTRAG